MLPCKVFLQRFISDDFDVNGSFCDHQTEDLSHLFWYCVYTKNLWKNILSAFHGIIPDISLKYENVIIGYTHESEQSDGFYLFNLILFLAKYFIHKSKFCKRKPVYRNFLEDLKLYTCLISE